MDGQEGTGYCTFGKKSDSNTENVYYMIVSDEKEFMKDYLEKYQLEAEDKPVKWRSHSI